MNDMKRIFRALLFVAALIPCLAQSHAENVKFYSINAIFGISMRETASVCSDDNGFIWVSSKTGVLRLTDDDCRVYGLPYQTADIIHVKLVYNNPVLLAYTNNGQIFRYNAINDRFDFLFDLRNPLNSIHLFVSNILVENQEIFWITSNMGLYKYQADELTLVHEEVTQAIWYDDQHLLFASDKGLCLLNVSTMRRNFLCEKPLQVQKLYYDLPAQKLWIGTLSNGIFRYDFNKHTFSAVNIPSFPKQPVLAIEANTDSTMLVGIDGQGVWEIDKNTDRVLNIYKEDENNPSSLRGDGVYDIFRDQNKRVWVCTYSGGVSFFDQISSPALQITHQINNVNSLSNNHVNQIIEDSRGNLWFATNNGINCWNLKTNRWKRFYHNKQEQAQVFLSLCEDDAGRIWAGTYSSGVYVLDGTTGRELAHYSDEENDSPINDYTFDIYKDSGGDLWIGGVSGEIIRYRVQQNRFQAYPSLSVYSFAELSHNKMLLACTYGLVLLDAEEATSSQLLQGYLMLDLLVLDGNVWICTSGNGLIYFDMERQTTEIFTTESGLPSNYVNSIAYSDGYLWLGTENGLCRFDPQNKTVQTYFTIFPLSRVSYNLNAHCHLKNGQLIWGTSNGAVLFDPANIYQLQSSGKIFFQDLFIAGRSVRDSATLQLNIPLDSLQSLKLKHHRNALSLELIPIGGTANAKFSWKMEGFDKEWSRPSALRVLTYTNIPYGKFNLKIRLHDSSLSYILDERDIVVEVVPPFWRTWWFLLLVFIFMVWLVYFFTRDYLIRLRRQHSEDKVRFFTNMAHEIRTSITLIKAPIEEISRQNFTETDVKYLNIAAEQARRLSSTVTHLLDFQKADIGKEQLLLKMVNVVGLIEHRRLMFESFAKNKAVELHFTAEPTNYSTAIDSATMEKVIDNLISNAVKYSYPDSRVELLFNGNEKRWTFEVKDYGIGISRKAQRKLFREFYRSDNALNFNNIGSGIGLLLAKHYVTLHGGTISCISAENSGSSFKIVVPFKKVETPDTEKKTEPLSLHKTANTAPSKDDRDTSKKMNLLIVEDNKDLQNFMDMALCEEFNTTTANDGVIAWEIIRKKMPDIVISDVMMPNMDGFELCRLIKSTFETSHVPVVLLTALTDKAEQLHGLGLGADNYLTKPFDMDLVTQRIRSIIQNRKAVRKKAIKMLEENTNEPLFINDFNDKFIKKAVQVVRENMDNEKFDKDDFASAMHVSSSLLYKKIKTLTDQTPVDFIKTIRLTHAMELLQERKYTVMEVSELCGFSSMGYFSTVFKKYFGKSPSEI